MNTMELLACAEGTEACSDLMAALYDRLRAEHLDNLLLSVKCGNYYKAMREHCKGINRLLRKKDHHRRLADSRERALRRIVDYPSVAGGASNSHTPYQIACEELRIKPGDDVVPASVE